MIPIKIEKLKTLKLGDKVRILGGEQIDDGFTHGRYVEFVIGKDGILCNDQGVNFLLQENDTVFLIGHDEIEEPQFVIPDEPIDYKPIDYDIDCEYKGKGLKRIRLKGLSERGIRWLNMYGGNKVIEGAFEELVDEVKRLIKVGYKVRNNGSLMCLDNLGHLRIMDKPSLPS